MSEDYINLKERFRRTRPEIDAEIKRRFEHGVRATDIMCVTWYVKQTLERMRSDVDECILCVNTLSTREVKILYKYIDILSDSYWDRLYDIAGNSKYSYTDGYNEGYKKGYDEGFEQGY